MVNTLERLQRFASDTSNEWGLDDLTLIHRSLPLLLRVVEAAQHVVVFETGREPLRQALAELTQEAP